MTIRKRRIPKIRLDKTNVDAPTINRALDNIIDNINPLLDELVDNGGSITITPQGAAAVQGNAFNLVGGNGITFSSNPTTDTITIIQTSSPATTITLNADTGSVSGSTFNIVADGCCIHTETSGSDTLIISSSAPCNFSGSTNISVTTPQSIVIVGANPNTIALNHFNSNVGTDNGMAGVYSSGSLSWQVGTGFYWTNAQYKFASGSAYSQGNVGGNNGIQLPTYNQTGALGVPYFVNADGLTGDFTFEFWWRPDATTGYGFQGLAQIVGASANLSLWMYLGQLHFGKTGAAVATGVTLTTPGVWYAIAICRSGSTIRLFVDGVLVYTTPLLDLGTGADQLIVGYTSDMAPYYGSAAGYYDEIRWSDVALYTASYTPATASFGNYAGVATLVIDNCTREFALTGAICNTSVITSSYPCPQYLNTPFTGANDAYVKIKNQITSKDIWLTPADQIDVNTKDRQNSIGLRGIDADQAVFYSWDGGDVKLLGGTSRYSHGVNAKGGNIVIKGGEGGGGVSGVDGSPGGDVVINGGLGGGPGVGANFGASGSILIGNNSNIIQIGNNTQNINTTYATTTTISGNFIAPILGDVKDTTNATRVTAMQGQPIQSSSAPIPNGAALIYSDTIGWGTQFITGSDPATISLLHFEGTNGSTIFPDTGYYSGSAQQIYWQQFGGADISTANYQFGTSSLYLQSVNNEYVTSSNTTLWSALGNTTGNPNAPNSDYTIECWFYLNTYGGSFGNTIFHVRNPSLSNPQNLQGIHAWVDNGGGLHVDNGLANFLIYPALVPTGSWHNLVIVRSGTAYGIYFDGTGIAGGVINGLDAGSLTNATLTLGQYGPGGVITTWDGYIDEFRVSNVARYSAGFLPLTMTTQSAEWPNAYPIIISEYGDISGSFAGFSVLGLQNNPLSASNPSSGSALVWDGNYWIATTGLTASNAISASYATTASFATTASWAQTANATYLQGYELTGGAPQDGDIMVFDGATNKYIHKETRYYGNFYDTTTQTASATPNTPLAMKLNSVVAADGFIIVSGSRITAQHDGTYNIQFSAQFDKTDAGFDDVDVWFRKNGTDIPYSNTQLTMNGNNTKLVAAWNYLDYLASGSYVEIMWWSADTDLRILAQGTQSNPQRPEIPSVIATITQV